MAIAFLLLGSATQRLGAVVTTVSRYTFTATPLGPSSSRQASLTFQLSAVSGNPTFALSYGTDFSVGTPACSGSTAITCVVPVNFSPTFAGLREDSIVAKDSTAQVLSRTDLYGIGLAPLLSLTPGIITTAAGTPRQFGVAAATVPAGSALFNYPFKLGMDPKGNLYVADMINNVIRKLDLSSGVVTIVAGTGYGGYNGDSIAALSAQLHQPTGVFVDAEGNVFIADNANNRIRRVDAASGFITTVAGGGTSLGNDGLGDGGLATAAQLYGPKSVTGDATGNLYISDTFNGLIRRVDATTGLITIYAGGGTNAGSDGLGDQGPATGAQLAYPNGLVVDSVGNLYVADTGNHMIRRIDVSSGNISSVAGTGYAGSIGDGGPATQAQLNAPNDVASDAAGNIFIVDTNNYLIRRVDYQSGFISTIAGSSTTGYSGDGSSASAAQLNYPYGAAVDARGNVYVADTVNEVIRYISFVTSSLSFGIQGFRVGSTPQSVVLSNSGTAALSISSVVLGGTNSGDFSQTSTCGNSLAPGASCTVTIVFAPTATGNRTGSLIITTNSAGSPQTVILSGIGQAAPQAVLSSSSLSFGTQSYQTSSASQSVVLSNSGTTALIIGSIALGGTNPADFTQTSTCGSSLSPGASCTISAVFTPTVIGNRTANIVVTTNSVSSLQAVTLNGSGQVIVPTGGLSFSTLLIPQGTSIQIGGQSSNLFLVMQGDGNLVLYQGGTALWNSGTGGQSCGTNSCLAVFQGDGNFVVYNGSRALWNSQTGGFGSQLILSDRSPHIEILTKSQSVAWTDSNQFSSANLTLQQGNSVTAGSLILVMQGDGNLVLYQGGTALWNSGTGGQNCGANSCVAVFQGDGNLVVYNGPRAIWNSQTGGFGALLIISPRLPYLEIVTNNQSIVWTDSNQFASGNLTLPQGNTVTAGSLLLAMQGDGNLVLYQGGIALWNSQTGGQNCGSSSCVAVFQGDGNLVIYNGSKGLWTSQTGGMGTQLILANRTPHMTIVNKAQSVIWSSVR